MACTRFSSVPSPFLKPARLERGRDRKAVSRRSGPASPPRASGRTARARSGPSLKRLLPARPTRPLRCNRRTGPVPMAHHTALGRSECLQLGRLEPHIGTSPLETWWPSRAAARAPRPLASAMWAPAGSPPRERPTSPDPPGLSRSRRGRCNGRSARSPRSWSAPTWMPRRPSRPPPPPSKPAACASARKKAHKSRSCRPR
mmetsp:Transcript_102474/g.200974  ORF Transcript_102474/g.200974 Transcript_102474/m.200974 type:complete len:201 (+) Transcript_102474:93-695(+)